MEFLPRREDAFRHAGTGKPLGDLAILALGGLRRHRTDRALPQSEAIAVMAEARD